MRNSQLASRQMRRCNYSICRRVNWFRLASNYSRASLRYGRSERRDSSRRKVEVAGSDKFSCFFITISLREFRRWRLCNVHAVVSLILLRVTFSSFFAHWKSKFFCSDRQYFINTFRINFSLKWVFSSSVDTNSTKAEMFLLPVIHNIFYPRFGKQIS